MWPQAYRILKSQIATSRWGSRQRCSIAPVAAGQESQVHALFQASAKEETMTDATYNVIKPDIGVPIKAWTKGVPLEDAARAQLLNVARLPFIYKWVVREGEILSCSFYASSIVSDTGKTTR